MCRPRSQLLEPSVLLRAPWGGPNPAGQIQGTDWPHAILGPGLALFLVISLLPCTLPAWRTAGGCTVQAASSAWGNRPWPAPPPSGLTRAGLLEGALEIGKWKLPDGQDLGLAVSHRTEVFQVDKMTTSKHLF